MRPQILMTWDQSFMTVLFKHYVSPNPFVLTYGYVVVVGAVVVVTGEG